MTVVMKTMDIELVDQRGRNPIPFENGIKFRQVTTSPSDKVNKYYACLDKEVHVGVYLLNFNVDYEKGWANFTVNIYIIDVKYIPYMYKKLMLFF